MKYLIGHNEIEIENIKCLIGHMLVFQLHTPASNATSSEFTTSTPAL
jgi:hypothetical protein